MTDEVWTVKHVNITCLRPSWRVIAGTEGHWRGLGGGLGSYVGDIQVGGYCGEDRKQINCRGKTISDDERKYR